MTLLPPSVSKTSSLKLTECRALIFDVYGTLIDWESPIHDALVTVFPDSPREEILRNYARVEGSLQMQFQRMSYVNILELAYRQLTMLSGVMEKGLRGEQCESTSNAMTLPESEQPQSHSDPDDAQRFGRSILDWQPFPDTVDALHRLKKHFALVVLSNVDEESSARTHAKLCNPNYPRSACHTLTPDSPFSLVLTAQRVGAYKPNPLMLASALGQLSAHPDPSLPSNPAVCVDASQVLVVANSMRHDILPAMQGGLRSVWISRNGANVIGNENGITAGHSDLEGATADDKYPYTWRYETLGRMADAAEREVASKTQSYDTCSSYPNPIQCKESTLQ